MDLNLDGKVAPITGASRRRPAPPVKRLPVL
jgi:hypothetical protein